MTARRKLAQFSDCPLFHTPRAYGSEAQVSRVSVSVGVASGQRCYYPFGSQAFQGERVRSAELASLAEL